MAFATRILAAAIGLLLPAWISLAGVADTQKLLASGGAVEDRFGDSVAIVDSTAVVGAALDDDDGPNSGAAFVFRNSGMAWSQEAKLTASDGAAGDEFGREVAIASSVAMVGASLDDDDGPNSGSAYVFRYDGSSWGQEAKLTASDGAPGDEFGRGVAIAGSVAVVGASLDDDHGPNSGSAYVFRYDGSRWGQEAKLTASDGASGDEFGQGVAVFGSVVVIGASLDDDDGPNSGSAYVFRYDGSSWAEEAKLTASDGAAADEFGERVAIFDDTLLVGSALDDDRGYNSGSAYVFRYDGSSWGEEAKLRASDGLAGDEFGSSVAMMRDWAIVGADLANDDGSNSGSAYVFGYDGSRWTQADELAPTGGGAGDEFGGAVGVYGSTAMVGADLDDDQGSGSGSVYVFPLPEPSARLMQASALAALACIARRLQRRRA